MKSYPIWNEEKRYRTGIKRSHPSKIVPKRPRGFGTYTKSQSTLLNIYFRFTSRSYSFTSAAIRIPVHTATKSNRDLSDMWWSICKTDGGQLRSVKVIAPKSRFSCVNRSPTRYERRADVVGEHKVNMNFPTSLHFLHIAESRQQSGYLDKGPMEFFLRGCKSWRWHHEEPNKLL